VAYSSLCNCLAAARALIDRPDTEAEEIVRDAMKIASDLCVYTNHDYIVEIVTTTKSVKVDEVKSEGVQRMISNAV